MTKAGAEPQKPRKRKFPWGACQWGATHQRAALGIRGLGKDSDSERRGALEFDIPKTQGENQAVTLGSWVPQD